MSERADMDEHIRNRAGYALEPGDVVVSWLSIAGIRNPVTGGGYVLLDYSNDEPPDWQLRGMLWDALRALDHRQYTYPDEDE